MRPREGVDVFTPFSVAQLRSLAQAMPVWCTHTLARRCDTRVSEELLNQSQQKMKMKKMKEQKRNKKRTMDTSAP